MHINSGRWTERELDSLIRRGAEVDSPGGRIAFLSEQFLGLPYQGQTLVGSRHHAEEFVVNLAGMDCFTFLDYIEAMRLAASFDQFVAVLKTVRYRRGVVSYAERNHFFTDWAVYRPDFIRDITEELGGGRAVLRTKRLNRKDDGTLFLDGIEPVDRTFGCLATDALDETVCGGLRTGDYAGICSGLGGLDVSHVGIIVRKGALIHLRHASSSPDALSVLDQDLLDYMAARPGLMIMRPL